MSVGRSGYFGVERGQEGACTFPMNARVLVVRFSGKSIPVGATGVVEGYRLVNRFPENLPDDPPEKVPTVYVRLDLDPERQTAFNPRELGLLPGA